MKKLLLLFNVLLIALILEAQSGTIDTTFNIVDVGNNFGGNPNSSVTAITIQPNNKPIVGGNFTGYSNSSITRFVRLENDGQVDTTFKVGSGFSGLVSTINCQADGKIIVGGWFSHYDGTLVNRIARLDSNGTLDTTFQTGSSFNGNVYAVAIQNDGKVVVGGQFSAFDGFSTNRLVRLDSNGTRDTTFNVGSGLNGDVNAIAVQADGKILVGGNFTDFNGNTVSRLVRLKTDGTVDSLFIIGTGFNNAIHSIKIQPDNKVLIGGDFTDYNGTVINRMIRLNTNGSIDPTFSIGSGFNGTVKSIFIQPNSNILVGGNFTQFNSTSANRVVRINTSGTKDLSFDVKVGANSIINTIAYMQDSTILLGGGFTYFNNLPGKDNLISINNDGSVNYSFNKGTGFNGTFLWETAIQADKKIIAVGNFYTYNGEIQNHISRINIDGTIDTTFNIGNGFNSTTTTTAILPNGKILVGGGFTDYDGTSYNRIIRLNSNGSVDPSFNIGSGFNSSVNQILLQPDGKIIVVGSFSNFNGNSVNKIVRLNANGSIDNSFSVGTGFNLDPWAIAIQSDGKIIVGVCLLHTMATV